MLTLRELKKMVKPAEKNGKLPTARYLTTSGMEPVVKEKIDNETEIMVYPNGYVLYKAGKKSTVFPLTDCGAYEYKMLSGKEKVYDASFFENENWYVRLIMEGEDLLERNQLKVRSNHKTISYDRMLMDCGDILDSGEDFLEKIISDTYVSGLLEQLNKRQRKAVYLFCIKEWKQKEISDYLGVSQQSVSAMLKRAFQVLEKAIREEK